MSYICEERPSFDSRTCDCELRLEIFSTSHLQYLNKDIVIKDKDKEGVTITTGSLICLAKVNGHELCRTNVCPPQIEPKWNATFNIPIDARFESKQTDYNRPFLFEYLEVLICDVTNNRMDKVAETRMPICDYGTKKWRKLVKSSSHGAVDAISSILIFFDIEGDLQALLPSNIVHVSLSEVINKDLPRYNHIFMDLSNDFCPTNLFGRLNLPGPTVGEIVHDMHEYVEPPPWGNLVSVKKSDDSLHLSCEELIVIRRMTYQLPIGALHACKALNVDENSSILVIEGKDCSIAEFLVRRPLPDLSQMSADSMDVERARLTTPNMAQFAIDHEEGTTPKVSGLSKSRHFAITSNIERSRTRRKKSYYKQVRISSSRIKSDPHGEYSVYLAGLDTGGVSPHSWCGRVADTLLWLSRLDVSWVKWAQYMKMSCDELQISDKGVSGWLAKARKPLQVEDDYDRMKLTSAMVGEDLLWRMSRLNAGYQFCATYPQQFLVPASLTDEDVCASFSERSKGRIGAITWMHPTTKVPLFRASQPMAGLSGTNTEADKKACLAIKKACPSDFPLRIADARPKLNANANSLQGKGFENVSYFGGPSVATISFLDIENIHVMRASLAKLREGWSAACVNSSTADSDFLQSSKWLNHISLILRGAAAVAESILLQYPVLVHCSDGWDRTPQLTALAQILLDPYYRTVEGLCVVINKEWCAFGHMFEHRANKSYSHKENSPVFLQFLDSIYQLIQHFEYTSELLVLLAQASSSGLFSTFRGDNENSRNNFIQQSALIEDMDLSDMDCSSVFFYINALLQSEMYNSILINPFYHPPPPAHKHFQYLRPRTSVLELSLWRDGLVGLNKSHLQLSLGPSSPTVDECCSVSSNVYGRVTAYLDLHKTEMDRTVSHRLDVLLHGFQSVSAVTPYQRMRLLGHLLLPTYRESNRVYTNRYTSMKSELEKRIEACVRIQLWYRSILKARVAAKFWVEQSSSSSSKVRFVRGVNSAEGQTSMGVASPSLKLILRTICFVELKVNYFLSKSIDLQRMLFCRFLVEEIVEDALVQSFENEVVAEGPMAIRRISSCSVSSSVEESSMRSTRKYQMKSTLESISTLAHGLMTSTDVTDSNKTNAYMSMTAYLKGSMSKPNISKASLSRQPSNKIFKSQTEKEKFEQNLFPVGGEKGSFTGRMMKVMRNKIENMRKEN